MIKGITLEGSELNLAEIKIQHQNWLQHPETRMVIQALRNHAKIHADHAFNMARLIEIPAEACKTQAATAFNLNHVLEIVSSPELLLKLLNTATKEQNN